MSRWKVAIVAALAATATWAARSGESADPFSRETAISDIRATTEAREADLPSLLQEQDGSQQSRPLSEDPGNAEDDWRDAAGPRRDDGGMWLAVGSFALMSFMVYRWISEDERPPTIFR